MYAIIYNLLHCRMGESMRTRLLFDSRVLCGQKLTFFHRHKAGEPWEQANQIALFSRGFFFLISEQN